MDAKMYQSSSGFPQPEKMNITLNPIETTAAGKVNNPPINARPIAT
jgi:hypothetical protein